MIDQIIMYPNKPPISDSCMFWFNGMFKGSKKFFKMPMMISKKFRESGIIKCFRSIKNITIKIERSIARKIWSKNNWYWVKINKKPKAVKSSTKKYWKGIIFLQVLHFLFNNQYDINGMLSYQIIFFYISGNKIYLTKNLFVLVICKYKH